MLESTSRADFRTKNGQNPLPRALFISSRTISVHPQRGSIMKRPNDVLNDLQQRVSELLRNSPARDVERNVKAMLSQGFSKLDLVTREEFDVQTQVLARTRARLEELERRLAELEQKLGAAQAQ
jgi:BMFP domain-containing protein YqiC